MSSLTLATKLADEFGIALDDAMRFVDDVGPRLGEEAAFLSTRTGKATALAGTAGGGALALRQQDVWQAEAEATESEATAQSLKRIMESDLSPRTKRQATVTLLRDGPSSTGQQSGGQQSGGGGLLAGLFGGGGFGGAQTTLALLVVLVLVVSVAGGGD